VTRIVYDTETNGLLHELTKIHCLCLLAEGDPVVRRYHDQPELAGRDGSLEEGLEVLAAGDEIWAHNGEFFDIPAIQKVYPGWAPRGVARDSIIAARTIWPDSYLRKKDAINLKRGRFPDKQFRHGHSLEAWGYRLGDYKGQSPESWDHLTPEMLEYCAQDVIVLDLLVRRILKHQPTEEQLDLETAFARIIDAQQKRGFQLDRRAVDDLVAKLTARRAELNEEISVAFPPFKDFRITPKRKIRVDFETPFNPNSRAHIARALREKYGWRPTKFTATGQAKVDEAIMKTLPYPEAKILAERLMIKMRLGQVAEGDEAWLKVVKKDGRVYGRVQHNAAVTGRCTHSKPNMSAVPKVQKPWGPECRRCWVAKPGHSLVVADAAGIDARVIAHYSYPLDNGEFARLLLESDIHTRNAEVLGTTRDVAKTAFYAILYGALGKKVGQILGVRPAAGEQKREALLNSLPGLGKLIRGVTRDAKARGWLRTLDGRRLWVVKDNAALNTLGQGGAAVLMKKAPVLAWRWTFPYQVMHVHDEMVCEVPTERAEECAADLVQAISKAGEYYRLRIPLAAHAGIGPDWTAK